MATSRCANLFLHRRQKKRRCRGAERSGLPCEQATTAGRVDARGNSHEPWQRQLKFKESRACLRVLVKGKQVLHYQSRAYNFAGYRLHGHASPRCGLWTPLVLDDVAANSANRKRQPLPAGLSGRLMRCHLLLFLRFSLFHVDLSLIIAHHNTCSQEYMRVLCGLMGVL